MNLYLCTEGPAAAQLFERNAVVLVPIDKGRMPGRRSSTVVNQQSEFSQLDSGLTIPVFKHGDDPIDAINHFMSFLSAVVTSRYPTTNNQLKNSSNPRQQATINDGRVTVQPVQGRQISYAAGTIRTFNPGASGSNSGKQRIVTCYNCKGEGHMSKQCTKPRRKRDDSWFKEKVLLVQAQASGQILHEEELAFLADPGIPEAQATQTDSTEHQILREMYDQASYHVQAHKGFCCDEYELGSFLLGVTSWYGYIKNHKKTVKNGQAQTRESEEYKKKPRIQNRSQKSQTRSQVQS
ncbi:integrase, catalytic region, zinc finger, CCHC-type containing protein [Tanacetum coccineum]